MKATKPTFVGGAVSYHPFRITGQGVLSNGEAKELSLRSRSESENSQLLRGVGCARLIVITERPETSRSRPGQVEAPRKWGGGPNRC